MAAANDAPMAKTLIEQSLDLEEIEENVFRSKSLWKPLGGRAVFGGQVVGQSLVAAMRTVRDGLSVHALHSFFLLPGDSERPILYQVSVLRDGNSFATRSVTAIQKGRAIFTCQVSFHRFEDFFLEHQTPMPPSPAPESLPSETERLQEILNDPRFPKRARNWLEMRMNEPLPIDIRMCERLDPFSPAARDPVRQTCWMRTFGKLGDDAKLHQAVAAYCSDHRLLSTPLLGHKLSTYTNGIQIMASLDHSMWFHAPFRADDWMLYEFDSHRMTGNRGLTFGRVYSSDGRLVISVAQEGLIRLDEAFVQKTRGPVQPKNNNIPLRSLAKL